jgi:hypothetical protein
MNNLPYLARFAGDVLRLNSKKGSNMLPQIVTE